MTVDVGLVTGMSAATTPMGSPIATTLVTSSFQSTPTVRTLRNHSQTPSALNRFLYRLSSALPWPVSSAARAPRRAHSGSMARTIASTIRSIVSWSAPWNFSKAACALSAAARAWAMLRRSASISLLLRSW